MPLHPSEALLGTLPASLVVRPWFDQLRVVLVRSRNPLNIGAAARAMSNFGFQHLRLVSPWEPSYLGARSAVGASQVLLQAEVFGHVAEAVADCSLVVGTSAVGERELHHPLRMLEQGADLIRHNLAAAPVALLFGSEKFGLSNEDLSHCHWLMRIPTRDEHISMNLGQAVAICLHELARTAASVLAVGETYSGERLGGGAHLTYFVRGALEAADMCKHRARLPSGKKCAVCCGG